MVEEEGKSIKIDDAVEGLRSTNPLIHGDALRLT